MNRIHCFLSYHLLLLQALQVRSESCRGERSQRGFALFYKNYSSSVTNVYPDCVGLCVNDLSCMSLNYWLDTKQCDLNTHSRETCPACYMEASSVYMGMARYPELSKMMHPQSCSDYKNHNPTAKSGNYVIDPDREKGLSPFTVYCDMNDTKGTTTVISHDSENETLVDGCEPAGCYSRDIHYTGASLSQLASLTRVSSHCEQFIKYVCYNTLMFRTEPYAWWVSRDSINMTYWGGASPGSGKCACGMTNSCADFRYGCNCDKNDDEWREDSGLLTDKTHLPVKQLRFGDAGSSREHGFHTLGKFKCRGIAT